MAGVRRPGSARQRDLHQEQLQHSPWPHDLLARIHGGAVGGASARLLPAAVARRRILVHVENEVPAQLTWISDDPLQLDSYQDAGRKLALKRGEVIPGFLYDLAPLATPQENRYWLRGIPPDLSWTPPTQETGDDRRRPPD